MDNLLRFKRKLKLTKEDALDLDALADYLAAQNTDDSYAKLILGLNSSSAKMRRLIHILLELSSDIKFEEVTRDKGSI